MKWGLIIFLNLIFCGLSGQTWDSYKKDILPLQKTFHGWCEQKKALKMMDLIYATRPQVCVELGVFGGSSVYPTAAALSYNGSGKIYAIDPWSTEECLQGYEPTDPNYEWWNTVDLEGILADFVHKMNAYEVSSYCEVLRMSSQEAVSYFEDESIDILHVDGNHSAESALQDVITYYPKVKSGGYIWFDDANWSSTAQAVDFLVKHCNGFIKERSLPGCLLFRKP